MYLGKSIAFTIRHSHYFIPGFFNSEDKTLVGHFNYQVHSVFTDKLHKKKIAFQLETISIF